VRVPVLLVSNTHRALMVMAARAYGQPASKLRLIGVTGTNGKTTTTYLLKAMLEAAGEGVGLLGTVTYQIGERSVPSTNTTPGMLELHRHLAGMVGHGLRWCAMEVSSHALDQGRIDGLSFDAGVLTNIGSDHLDYHHTREQYAAAKRRLFDALRPNGHAVLNLDDAYGRAWYAELAQRSCVTYSIGPEGVVPSEEHLLSGVSPMVRARHVHCGWDGISLVIESPWGAVPVGTPLVGRHNVENIVAASATALALGIAPSAIQRALATFAQVPGRMERVSSEGGVTVVIDYAHTADALRLVLLALRELVRGRVIVVFGCGGNRDQSKRPVMGEVASVLADQVVLTSDNPRQEDPLEIIEHVKAGFVDGFSAYQIVPDREQAIATALSLASADDAVLVAGKGHEAYQIFDHTTVPFSDRAMVQRYLDTRSRVAVVSSST
jgi:UDP-N-acetylmuramoyl-L-alanyl-D-glutamate--2,6-diaminopimelate ligase